MRPDLLSSKMEHVNMPAMPSREDVDRFKGRLLRTKTISSQHSVEEAEGTETGEGGGGKTSGSMQRVLTTFDLVSLGVGSCVGTGMYVVAGLVARNVAGPSTVLSFMIAGFASILSGVCYGEFGVRVPKTSGSAYMYSYVTVGEFVAFLIGWNLILEYMIGSAAGASAISACFDALGNHSMSRYLEENVGTIIGKTYPDFLGFFICLGMTVILAAGVKNSVIFNNVLNAINFIVWLFIFIAGFWFVDGANWRDVGFAPYGSSGVFSGAATCFYAFIGFDIIATTGEEAKTPGRSIPIAIVSSLVICLVAYVTVTMTLTLMIPMDEIHGSSALIDMFVQVDFGAAKWVVALGALASLTVSLLGSMFPMPRVIYAMARDGLLFEVLAYIHPTTNTPLLATLLCGLISSILSLVVGLQVLVEMMSIGTLLAYTLVTVSVLILRYQPDKDEAIHLVHKKLATIEESPDSETVTSEDDPYANDIMSRENRKKVKDDATLLSPTGEKQNYGSLPSALEGTIIETKLAMLKRYCHMWWLRLGFPDDDVRPTETTAKNVIIATGVLAAAEITTCLLLVFGDENLRNGDWWAVILVLLFFTWVVGCLVVILRQPQNKKRVSFMAPAVPLLPCTAMFFNIYLMLKLPPLTWMRLAIWILIGLLMYFGYSMLHSIKERKQRELEQLAAQNKVAPPADADPKLHAGYEQTDVDSAGFILEQPSLEHLGQRPAPVAGTGAKKPRKKKKVQSPPAPPGAPAAQPRPDDPAGGDQPNGGFDYSRGQRQQERSAYQQHSNQYGDQSHNNQYGDHGNQYGDQYGSQPQYGDQSYGDSGYGNTDRNTERDEYSAALYGGRGGAAAPPRPTTYHGHVRSSSGPNPPLTERDDSGDTSSGQQYSASRYPFRSNSVSPPSTTPPDYPRTNPFRDGARQESLQQLQQPDAGASQPRTQPATAVLRRNSQEKAAEYNPAIARARPRGKPLNRNNQNNPFSLDRPAPGDW